MKSANPTIAHLGAIELKDEGGDDPNAIVTKALADLTKTVDDRLKAVETKTGDAGKLADRLDKLEAKANRPAGTETKDVSAESKAFGDYLRLGDRAPEIKTLTVSSDPQGGYLAPTEMASTPVSAMARTVCRFTPPDASSLETYLFSATASRSSARLKLSSMMTSGS